MTTCLGRELLERPVSGDEIERLSFERIEGLGVRQNLTDAEWLVARRLVHTTGDGSVARSLVFAAGWEAAATAALRAGEAVYCDAAMAKAGISRARLARATSRVPEIVCEVAAPDVAAAARESGVPRSVHAVRKAAAAMGTGGIWLFGNAPTGLMELVRLHREEGFRPSFVAALPVGFVHVTESKTEFMETGLPGLALRGSRGGSPLAVACLAALCALAEVRP